MSKKKLHDRIIAKQFEIIGHPEVNYKDFPEDGYIIVKKKKIKWYEYYKFVNQAQYEAWRDWAKIQLEKEGDVEDLYHIDMKYGLLFRYEKEEQLNLFKKEI